MNGLSLDINKGINSSDLSPIEKDCPCQCCMNYTRAAIHLLFRSNQSAAASILSIHNLYHQKRLMTEMRDAILADKFPLWVRNYIKINYGMDKNLPEWASFGLAEVGID